MTTEPQTAAPLSAECTCTELNRRLMAHLLRVGEGDVHEAGCFDRAFAQGAAASARSGLDAGLREALFDVLGHLCDWSANAGGDRCKAHATGVRQRMGEWVPVCDDHAALSSGEAAPTTDAGPRHHPLCESPRDHATADCPDPMAVGEPAPVDGLRAALDDAMIVAAILRGDPATAGLANRLDVSLHRALAREEADE